MSDQEKELLERLGGPPAIVEIVQEMYRRVLADRELAPFFEKVSIERLRHMQYEFIVSALNGPVAYTGAELTAVHHGRGITGHHFAKFCGHFADALEARGIGAHDIDLALSQLAMFKDKITGDSNYSG